MLMVISPAKTLDFQTPSPIGEYTQPDFLKETKDLVAILQNYSVKNIQDLMKVSEKIAKLNVERYKDFSTKSCSLNNAKQALMAFKGDVYEGMDMSCYTKKDFEFANKNLRILSGLYGILRPLDLIQPHRLEMGTKLPNKKGENIYDFWGDKITKTINKTLESHKTPVLLNLASNEYWKSVKKDKLNAELITLSFKEFKQGDYKTIGILAKRARGMMASHVIKNRISNKKQLHEFNDEGYKFNKKLSTDTDYVFTRKKH